MYKQEVRPIQITTPIGQSVVLGVTPTDGMTSVFVVQVLRK